VAVRPWSTEDLAKVSGPFRALFDLAAHRLGFPGREGTVFLAALGEVTVTCAGVGPPLPPGGGDTLWALRRRQPDRPDAGPGALASANGGGGATRGFILMDALSCLALVSATLGLPPPKVHRAPTPIEIGIVAATLGALARKGDPSLSIDLEPVVDWPGVGPARDALVQLELKITCASFQEAVRVQIPPSWIPSCPAAARGARAVVDRVPVRLSVEVARTHLPLGDWARAAQGDAVVFDGFPAARQGASWPSTLCLGRHAAAALWEPTGLLRLTSDFRPTDRRRPRIERADVSPERTEARVRSSPADSTAPPLHPERRTPPMADDEKLARLSMLASAPLEVVAEVGELILRADELIALQKGSVISLRRPRSTLVELKIADRVWARGELVDVDGELGVRVTELTAPEPPSTANATATAAAPADTTEEPS
jgi:type III secretion system YscQ/HrcQ family protein